MALVYYSPNIVVTRGETSLNIARGHKNPNIVKTWQTIIEIFFGPYITNPNFAMTQVKPESKHCRVPNITESKDCHQYNSSKHCHDQDKKESKHCPDQGKQEYKKIL